MSSTTIPKSFFDAAELVSDPSDPSLDLDQVVFMTDSENSNSLPGAAPTDIALQEVVFNLNSELITDENPIHVTVKQEEECIIMDDGVEDENEEESEIDSQQADELVKRPESPSYDTECIISTLSMPSEDDDEVNQGASTSFSADCEIIRIVPPSGMCSPPSQPPNIPEDEQFEIIKDDSPDTSLVDHPYSQTETGNKEFCDDLLQDMLKDTGLEKSPALVSLLSKFNKMFEHFVEEDAKSQAFLYCKSMANVLEFQEKKLVQEKRSETPPPKTGNVLAPDTQSQEIEMDTSRLDDTMEDINLPETETEAMEDIDLPETQTEAINEEDKNVAEIEDSEDVKKLKADMKLVEEIAAKVMSETREILKLPLKTEDEAGVAKEKLNSLIKNARQELHDVQPTESSQSKTKNKKRKFDFIDSDSDSIEALLNLTTKKSRKSDSQTPAIVSSTKEDSDDDAATDEEETPPERRASVSSGGEKGENDKEIQRLLNFDTLHNKPAPSKTQKPSKKLKKVPKEKAPGDGSSSYSSFSDSDDDSEDETTNGDEADSETTDEEAKLQRKVNNQNKLDLLADSEDSESSAELSDDLAGILSSDEEETNDSPKPLTQKPPVKKSIDLKKAVISESDSDDETSDDERKSDSERKSKIRKIRNRQNSFEREVKILLNSDSEKASPEKKPKIEGEEKRKNSLVNGSPSKRDKSPEIGETLFETTRAPRKADIQAAIEKRNQKWENYGASTSTGSTTPAVAGPSTSAAPSTPSPSTSQKQKSVTNEEFGWISLSSDSDSEISAATSGTNSTFPNRKKMLSEEELQQETKDAQNSEKLRVKRLEKKLERLSQIQSQRISQDPLELEPLVLDFNKDNTTIEVHPELVKCLKNHQIEGVKFMYDTCYGSVSDKEVTASGCILAHCMGLGKTLQLITLIHTLISYPQLKTKHILVICPKSTISNWRDEVYQWLNKRGIDLGLKVYSLAEQMKFEDRIRVLEAWHTSKNPGVFLLNYEAFRNLVNYSGKTSLKAKVPLPPKVVQDLQEKIARFLLSPGPDLIVCDEGHLIKNLTSKITKAISKIETRRRIILTGTPVQNNLNEYYAMVHWIKPAILGTVKEFNNIYANPIRDGQHVDSDKQTIKKMKQRCLILNNKLSNFVQRKEASVLREFLPEKYEYCIFVPLTKIQEDLYKHFLNNINLSRDGGKRLLNDYTALRKVWTHPMVLQNAHERAMQGIVNIDGRNNDKKRNSKVQEDGDEPDDDLLDLAEGVVGVKNNWWSKMVSANSMSSLYSSNKLLLLFKILKMCQERKEKVLVFSAFVAVLNIVEYFMRDIHNVYEEWQRKIKNDPNAQPEKYSEVLSSWKEGLDYFRLDGSTKRENRHEMVQEFNKPNPRMRCFLISSKAGGQGINLIGANRCIILDTSWNPSSDQQNIFRIYRLGQKKPCYVYRLIAIGTMEEKVYSRSVTKQAMSGRVVDKMQIDRHYRMNELSELYSFTPCDFANRPAQNMPQDDILKKLLLLHPNMAFKYHDHDSLLENKPEQDLSEEEIKEAWLVYEQEVKGVTARNTLGPQLPLLNDLSASMYNSNFFPAASSLDSTSSLLQQLYTGSSYNALDFMTMFPRNFDFGSYRNLASTSASTSGVTGSASASQFLRNQLNSGSMPFPALSNSPLPVAFSYPTPSTSHAKPSILAAAPKRQSIVKKPPPPSPSSVESDAKILEMQSLQKRIYRNQSENPIPQNSSANISILPDRDENVQKSSMQQQSKTSQGNKGYRTTVMPQSKQLQKTPSMTVQQIPPSVQPGTSVDVQRSPNVISSNEKSSSGAVRNLINVTGNSKIQKIGPSSGAARTIALGNITKNSHNVSKAGNVPMNTTHQVNILRKPTIPPNKPVNTVQTGKLPSIHQVLQRQPQKPTQVRGSPGTSRPSPQKKIVINPQHANITPKIVPANPKTTPNSTVSKSIQLLQQNSAGSSISITKLNSGQQKIAPKPPMQTSNAFTYQKLPKIGIAQPPSRLMSNPQLKSPQTSKSVISPQPSGSSQLPVSSPLLSRKSTSVTNVPKVNLQSTGNIQKVNSAGASGVFPRTPSATPKRAAETSSQSPSPQSIKRMRFALPPNIKITPRDPNKFTPSEIVDIVEIE